MAVLTLALPAVGGWSLAAAAQLCADTEALLVLLGDEDAFDSAPPRFSVPLWMAWVGVPFSVTWAWLRRERPLFSAGSMHMLTHQCRDVRSDKAIDELGHSPRPIEETLADTFAWFREHGHLDGVES